MRSSGGVQRPTEVKVWSSGLYKEKEPGLMQVPSNWAHQEFGLDDEKSDGWETRFVAPNGRLPIE